MLFRSTFDGSAIELNYSGSGNRYAYIDFHGDDTYTDYGFRIIRDNTGPNAGSSLYHRGTGALGFATVEAAPITFISNNVTTLYLSAINNVGIGNTSPGHKLSVSGTAYFGGVVTQAHSVWHTSSDGVGRYYYGNNARTYYKSGDGSHEFRNSSDTGVFFIETNGNVGIGTTTTAAYKLQVNGSFAATTKSFVIDHPSKPGFKLRYGSLEGPENGVYVRGKTNSYTIDLPDYWVDLVEIGRAHV